MQRSELDARVSPAWRMQDTHSVIHENARSRSNRDSASRRRRKPLACETCYKRKIKCEVEGSNETCIQCMRRNIACKSVSRRGKREHLKRSLYVKNLEERLKKTEALLRAAGILNEDTSDSNGVSDDPGDYSQDESDFEYEDDPSASPQIKPSRRSSGESEHHHALVKQGSASLSSPTGHSPDAIPSKFPERGRSITGKVASSVPISGNRYPPQYYVGRSSPLSILTSEGIEWIKSKSGEAKFLSILLSSSRFDTPWDHWRPDVFYDVFSSKVFKPLPPRAEVFSLLQDYFRTVNRIFPLYHEPSFMQLVEWQYTQQTCDDAARWASINIILALAYEYRYSNSQKSEKDREKAWLYYKNALSVFSELVLRRIDLLSVQALLGMALFLRGNSGTQSTVPIVTAALRSSHRMGLHRDIPRPNLTKAEIEQRKRVFWIAYIFDQSTCIRLGNAPTQQFDDFDVDFPSEEADNGVVVADNMPFFPRLCRISVIKSRIYSSLYSARALENKSAAEICEIVHSLHAELEAWKGSSRFDSLLKKRGAGEDFLVGFASAGLFFVYYNSLIMVHRIPMLLNVAYQSHLDRVSKLDAQLMLTQSSSSAVVCVKAARDTLKLVNNLPWGDIAWIWSLLYYVFLAVMTIFTNILRNSQQPTAKDDLQSLNMAATFFATLVPSDGPCNYARFMTRMSTTFERVARTVFERDQKTPRPLTSSEKKNKSFKPREATTTNHRTSSSSTFSHHLDNNKPSPSTTPSSQPNHSTTTSTGVSNLDGLPPINSSGYVVRESPIEAPEDSSIPIEPIEPTGPKPPNPSLSQSNQPHTILNNPTTQFPPQTNPYILENIPFPFPTLEEINFPQPDLWQIPMTVDWELGSQFLGGIFGHPGNGNGQNYFFPGTGEPTAPAAAATTMPSAPIPDNNNVGFGYGNQGNVQGSESGQQSGMWMGGNYPNIF